MTVRTGRITGQTPQTAFKTGLSFASTPRNIELRDVVLRDVARCALALDAMSHEGGSKR